MWFTILLVIMLIIAALLPEREDPKSTDMERMFWLMDFMNGEDEGF